MSGAILAVALGVQVVAVQVEGIPVEEVHRVVGVRQAEEVRRIVATPLAAT
jgi:hypothetical protein